MTKPALRIVRLTDTGAWMVYLYDTSDALICICGPYSARERDACVGLFSEWEPVLERELTVEQVHREIIPPPAVPIAAPVRPRGPSITPKGRRWWRKAQLVDREAARWTA